MSNSPQNPQSCQTNVSGSGYINNATTVDEIANNAKFQMGNIEYYLSIKNYDSALIKANCLVSELQDIMAFNSNIDAIK